MSMKQMIYNMLPIRPQQDIRTTSATKAAFASSVWYSSTA